MAIDVGTVRIGLASCDPEGILASPMPAIPRNADLDLLLGDVVKVATELEVIEVIVGDPVSLSGQTTASTDDARNIARRLSARISIPVRLVDERLTTVSAATKLRQAGKDAKSSKGLIDSASAVEILEQALTQEKLSGQAPGELVGDSDG